MISIRRRPTKSDSRPPSSSNPPKASEYAVTTHCRSALENPSALWAEGSAMFTIVASRITISWASPTTPRIHQRRADPASTSDGTVRPGAATAGSLIQEGYVGRGGLRKAAGADVAGASCERVEIRHRWTPLRMVADTTNVGRHLQTRAGLGENNMGSGGIEMASRVAVIGAGPCGLAQLDAFEQARRQGA